MRFAITIFSAACAVMTGSCYGDNNWPQFRGPEGSGIGSGNPPVSWNVDTGENIAWKTNIPGLGHSSPVVWQNRVFLTTAVNEASDEPSLEIGWLKGSGKSAADEGKWRWLLQCYELSSGKLLWSKQAAAGEPQSKRHTKASHANCTPATNGNYVVAFFGSEGLFCFDMQGSRVWNRNLGTLHAGPYDDPELDWGFASSPVIYDNQVVVQCDCLNEHFVLIMDISTGDEVLRIDRGDEVATWSTPAVFETSEKTQLVCNGYRRMAGYDFKTGEELWHLSDGGDIPVPTPIFDGDHFFLTNGHKRNPIFAVSPTARGNLTMTKKDSLPAGLKWSSRTDGCYMPTPLVKDGLLYSGDDDGKLSVRDAETGKLRYRKRIGTGSRVYSASPVAAGNHIYFTSERGEVTVIKAGPEFRKTAANEMEEIVMATPAITGHKILFRTIRELICISAE